MNYAFTDAIIEYFVKDEISMTKMVSELNNQLMLYREQTNQVQFNILDSHDTPRLLTLARGDKDLMRQVMAFTYLQQGVPCLYYGDEIGLTGDMDPDCRKCMIWEEEKQDRDLLHFTRSLISIRKDNQKVLSEGSLSWNWVSEEDGLIIFERELGAQRIIGIFNTGDDQITLSRPDSILMEQFVQLEDETMIIDNKGFAIVKVNNEESNEA